MKKHKGHLVILSGPSGVGKNAVERRLRELIPGLERVVTSTTREPRPHEQHGRDYYFFTKSHFQKLVDEGAFIEWAVVHDHMYGALRKTIEDDLEKGKSLLLIVDVQGAIKYKEEFPDSLLIFLEPESMDQLKKHLSHRYEARPAELQLRLHNAEKELAMRSSYDEVVTNKEGQIEKTAQDVARIIRQKLSHP